MSFLFFFFPPYSVIVAAAYQNAFADCLAYRNQDKPSYHPGLYACIACTLLNMILVGILTVYFKIENRRADRGEKELESNDEDFQPGFRYTC